MTCLFECMNDGKCVFYMGRYMCNCRTGYTGDACQVRYNIIRAVNDNNDDTNKLLRCVRMTKIYYLCSTKIGKRILMTNKQEFHIIS